MPFHISYIGLLDSDRATGQPRAESHLCRLAREVVSCSHESVTVELISCGLNPGTQTLAPGVTRTILPLAGHPRTPWDSVSWQLPEKVADSDLVHLHESFSRSCEVGLLVAKLWRRPVCLTEYGLPGDWLALELGLAELADVVICHSEKVVGEMSGAIKPRVVPCELDIHWLGVPAEWPFPVCRPAPSQAPPQEPHINYKAVARSLYSIYCGLLETAKREAA